MANIFEKIADTLGRQIRYGESPSTSEGLDLVALDALVEAMVAISDRIYSLEQEVNADSSAADTPQARELWELLVKVTALQS